MNRRLFVWLTFVSLTCCPFAAAQEQLKPLDISFTAKHDGSEQQYILLFPPEFDKAASHSLMIALHGHGSDRWQFIQSPRGECAAARDVAAKYGMIFLAPDYRAKTSWMGPTAEADVLQILEEVKAEYKIDKTLIMGGSMGGSSALTFTALHPERIDGVVALNGTANHLEYEQFQEFIAASYGGTKKEIPEEYKRRSAEYWPERFTMPIAMTTGGQDTLVPPESCQRLASILKKLHPHTLLIHRPEVGHSTNYKNSVAALEFVCSKLFSSEKQAD
ncbi:acyl-CoA esterase [Polystyrenella longa]|uniref:Acyl-CoA esterase n=1 Tax=Polystyrenella longa TaxID=2528007 RepID=A0A518CJW9_9PLAN|nr:alpha/beta fold hydrolase [Polystyrenella longa]QDU79521.1 acyl-CoA esterase [Polystyrenella longa]